MGVTTFLFPLSLFGFIFLKGTSQSVEVSGDLSRVATSKPDEVVVLKSP